VLDVKVMAEKIGLPIRKLPEDDYGSNQNQETSAYLIGDQTQ
jgi:hypothetical protein